MTGPGISPTPAEHLRNDLSGREFQRTVLPALIDRADPTRVVILWDEIPKPDPRQQALQQAAQVAEQLSGFRDASRRAAVAVIGAVLPVRIDPADPARVAIEVAAFDAQNPSS